MNSSSLVLGTRGSALALRQAQLVRDRLEALGHSVQLREIKTTGDRILDVPLSQIGEKALFTKELDQALLDGSIQLAVHSLKDLPTQLPAGLRIAAVPEREDPHDVFVANPEYRGGLAELPVGATLATSSLRRTAQLKAWRSDLNVVPVRGNVDTRLAKLDNGSWHGIILAGAGLRRLGLHDRIREVIDEKIMLPAVGQGALGIVCAEEDVETAALLRTTLHNPDVWAAVQAERALLRRLEGGCSVPIGSLGLTTVDEGLTLDGCVVSLDGSTLLRDRVEGPAAEAEQLGHTLAERLLGMGAEEILESIREAQG